MKLLMVERVKERRSCSRTKPKLYALYQIIALGMLLWLLYGISDNELSEYMSTTSRGSVDIFSTSLCLRKF